MKSYQTKYDDMLEKSALKVYQITKSIKKQEKYQVEIDSIKTFFAIIVFFLKSIILTLQENKQNEAANEIKEFHTLERPFKV